MNIHIQRVYDPPVKGGGPRFLVERLWPRGIKKEALHLTAWCKDAAPSTELRRWFQHDPAKWPEFQRRYRAELQQHPQPCATLLQAARRGPITLLYSAKDTEHNSAVVLRNWMEENLRA